MDTHIDIIADTSRDDVEVLRGLSSLDASGGSVRDRLSGAHRVRLEAGGDEEGVLLAEAREEGLEGAVDHEREPDGCDDLGEVLRGVRVALEAGAGLPVEGLYGEGELAVLRVPGVAGEVLRPEELGLLVGEDVGDVEGVLGGAEEAGDEVEDAVEELAHEGDLLEVLVHLAEEAGRGVLGLTDELVGAVDHEDEVQEVVGEHGLGLRVHDARGDAGDLAVDLPKYLVEDTPDGVVGLIAGVGVPGLDEGHHTTHLLLGLFDQSGDVLRHLLLCFVFVLCVCMYVV